MPYLSQGEQQAGEGGRAGERGGGGVTDGSLPGSGTQEDARCRARRQRRRTWQTHTKCPPLKDQLIDLHCPQADLMTARRATSSTQSTVGGSSLRCLMTWKRLSIHLVTGSRVQGREVRGQGPGGRVQGTGGG